MHLSKDDIPVRIDIPGAVARQLPDFGIADGPLGVEYFTLATGTDMAPLLVGLEDDACQAEHWGYLVSGRVVVTYSDRSTEQVDGLAQDLPWTDTLRMGLTHMPQENGQGLCLVRALGVHAQDVKTKLIELWQHLRPLLLDIDGAPLRLWKT